jgi:nicotinamidase-related amidase
MGDYVLLIIDPQVDFHEGGNLGVYGVDEIGGKGGKSDSANIIKLIQKKAPAAVYVSLDTHTPTHIGHQAFWQPEGDPNGEGPAVGSQFVVNEGKVAVANLGVFTYYEPRSTGDDAKDADLKKWVVQYVQALTGGVGGGEKFSPCIWPNHCLEGSAGHAVYPELKAALDALTCPVEYHVKGQNEATEMYSIFKAELPVEGNASDSVKMLYRGKREQINTDSKIGTLKSDVEDHANLKTDFNEGLYNSLVANNLPIVVCGEALSHCVKWSTNDLVSKKNGDDKYKSIPVILLEDASSVVNLEGVGAPRDLFIPSTLKFKKDSQKNGVNWLTTEDFIKYGSSAAAKSKYWSNANWNNFAAGVPASNIGNRGENVSNENMARTLRGWAKGGGNRKTKKGKKSKKSRKTRGRK